jgi:O-glycosyl hydrolase
VKYLKITIKNLLKTSNSGLLSRSKFSSSNLLLFALIFAVFGGYFIYSSFAANPTLTVNGSQKSQTIDGFGGSINSHSWKNGQVKPALDLMISQDPQQLFRVVMEMTDWESSNDDSNSNNYNWAYYNNIYSGATSFDTAQAGANFGDLWNTIDYLHQKGIPDNQIILSFMGPGPSWNGGGTVSASQEDEWAEMVTSAAYYGYSHGHTFGLFSPNNEEDWGFNEGIVMSASVYAASLNKVSQRLDALGLSSIRLLGPEVAVVGNLSSYVNAMKTFPAVMAKVDHLDQHNYSGDTGTGSTTAANAGKNFWQSEFTDFSQSFSYLNGGASALMVWEAFDSVYNHGIINGLGSSPGNDDGFGPAPIAYNSSTGVYTPRKTFYQFGQIFKFIPAGSVKVAASTSSGSITTQAYYHQASNKVTIVGQNTSASAITLSGSLSNVGTQSALELYYTDNGSANMQQLSNVAVSGGAFTFSAPANSVFTLTTPSVPDTTSPAVSITAPATGVTISGTTTISANATDDVAVAGVQFKLDGANLQSEVTSSPYSINWNTFGVANGSHTLSAVARDAAGNSTTSSTITVTVSNAVDTTAPTVTMSAPAPGATISGQVAVSANAADTGGSGLAGVQFKLDGSNLQSEDTSSPYSITWDTNSVADGSHTLTAVARDGAGNITTSSATAVTVKNAAPTGTLLLGSQSIQSSSDTNASGDAEAFRYAAVASGATGTLSFYINSGNSATTLKLGVYSDNSGHPGTLLSSGTATGFSAGSWATVNLAPAANLTNGTTYWIAFLGTGGTLAYRDLGSGGCSESYSTSSQTNLPSTWSSGQVWPSCTISAYVLAGSTSTGPKTGDINGDSSVNITDLSFLLSSYGQNTTQCTTNTAFKCDLSSPGDGVVNIFDLSILLSNYGT